jgi:hypothetical protein
VGEALKPGPAPEGHRRTRRSDRTVPLVVTLERETEERYERGLLSLEKFCAANGHGRVEQLAEQHPREFNKVFQNWIQECFEAELPRYHAESGLLGAAKKFWWIRPQLKPSWDLVEEWTWREPTQKRAPVPLLVVRAMLAVAGSWKWWGMGLVLWMSFHGLLRPGEAVDMKKKHVRFAHALGSRAKVVVLVIAEAKTRRKAARVQHVILEEPLLVTIAERFCSFLGPEDPLFPLSGATYDKRFGQLLTAIGLQPGDFTPAGLRAGGATEEWVRFRDIQALRLRGRWMQLRTLEHYVQEAVATLGVQRFSPRQMELMEKLAGEAGAVWRTEWVR